ncbi:MAG: NADH-quinone oxidoreductase subunit NuoH [Chloroflexota bacterium]
MSELWWIVIETVIKALIIVGLILTSAAISVYLERKISAFIQNRIGPNRVGPLGLLQPIADVVKLFWKEDIVPKAADRFFHSLAPVITLGIAISVWAVIPFGEYVNVGDRVIEMGIAPNVNFGILYILALTSVGVYGITLAGWSSNSKYSLFGGLRSAAQMISYELSMGISILAIVVLTGSLSLVDIVRDQQAWAGWRWNILLQPIGFFIFLLTAFAETNRAPFDLPEAEPELVGGFNTEYSGMKFGMFFLAEYANIATSSAIISILYLGGWTLPVQPEVLGLERGTILLALLEFLVLLIKIAILIFVFVWVRWSVPRFRYDQLMNLGWRVLLPLSLLNFMATAIVVYFYYH